jgi:hypothetical protein
MYIGVLLGAAVLVTAGFSLHRSSNYRKRSLSSSRSYIASSHFHSLDKPVPKTIHNQNPVHSSLFDSPMRVQPIQANQSLRMGFRPIHVRTTKAVFGPVQTSGFPDMLQHPTALPV